MYVKRKAKIHEGVVGCAFLKYNEQSGPKRAGGVDVT
jgi:hypothetical protein